MKAKEDRYIYPPRTELCLPKDAARTYLDQKWIAQFKYNDSHTLVKLLPGGRIEIWNRHGERLKGYTAPDWLLQQITEAARKLQLDHNEYHLLDGGLLDQKHRAIKDTIVIWDILVRNGEHLLRTTYTHRLHALISTVENIPWIYTSRKHDPVTMGIKVTDNIFLPINYTAEHWDMIWDTVNTVNAPFTIGSEVSPVIEGIMLKNPIGKLEMGIKMKNNDDWMIKSRITTGRHRY